MEIMVNHICPVEAEIIMIAAGEPCSWCGKVESPPERPQESEKPDPLP